MPTTSAQAVAPATRRIPLWDNARFLAVTLVVVGHGIQRLTADSNNALIVYLFIYGFHMPAFAIISGYFSTAGPPTLRRMKRILTRLVIPYLVMEAIWSLVQFLVEGRGNFNPSKPSWTLWFLLAQANYGSSCHLALLRWPLILSLLFSVGVGYLDNVGSTFSLSRAIGIMPFFILGWKVRQWGIVERWQRAGAGVWWVRVGALAVFAGWLGVLGAFIQTWRDIDLRFWFFYDDSYSGLGLESWWAGLIRLGLIVVAVILCAAFLALVPRRVGWMTDLGKGTMYVYLLHSFVLYPLRESGFLGGQHASATWLVLMVVASIATSLVLATRPVRRLFRPIIEPRADWLFASTPREPRGQQQKPTSLPRVAVDVAPTRRRT